MHCGPKTSDSWIMYLTQAPTIIEPGKLNKNWLCYGWAILMLIVLREDLQEDQHSKKHLDLYHFFLKKVYFHTTNISTPKN